MFGSNIFGSAYPGQGYANLISTSATWATVAKTDSPTSIFLLDETSGTSAADAVGSNTGTYVNSPTLAVAGLAQGTAVQFVSASSQELTLPGPAPSATSDYTVEVWFKWTAGTAILRDNTSGGGYILGYDSSGFFSVRLGGNSVATSISTANARDGLRHQLVVTKAGTTATAYFDGIICATWTISAPTAVTTPWHVMRNGSTAGQYSDGVVDAIAFYPSALSQTRVLAHFNAGIDIFGFLGAAHTTSTFQSSGTSINTTTPKANTGDVLIAILQNRAYCNPSPPAGWTTIDTDPGSGAVTRLYYRVVDGTEGSSYTWTSLASDRSGLVISRLVNLDSTTPFESYAKANGTSGGPASLTLTSLTPTQAGDMLIGIGGANSTTAQSVSVDAAMTKVYGAGGASAMSIGIGQEFRSSTSATGTRTFTAPASSSIMFGASMLLQPSVVIPTSGGGTTQTGSASLSGTGTLSATAQHIAQANATLSGTGTLGGSAQRGVFGTGTLSGTGTLGAVGYHEARAGAALSGTGTLGAAGQRTQQGSVGATGVGTLSATVQHTLFGNASLSGSGTLGSVVTREVHGSVTASGTGTLGSTGVRTQSGTANISGSGVLTVAATVERLGSVLASGSGTLAGSGTVERYGLAALAAAGTLVASGQISHGVPTSFVLLQQSVPTVVRALSQDGTITQTSSSTDHQLSQSSYTLRNLDGVVSPYETVTVQTVITTDGERAISTPATRVVSSTDKQIVLVPA